jgi:hypothetical protein
MSFFFVPQTPLTDEQRIQLWGDMIEGARTATPQTMSEAEIWCVLQAAVYFLTNPPTPPTPPPPEE